MSKFKSLFLGCFCLMLVSNLSAQLEADQSSKKNLPEVFQIGEHEEAFEALSFTYNTSLLAACDENMDMAYKKWLDMLQSLESFGHSNGVDLNGVKMWLNVFWDKNGGIDHMAYFLKPQSKNIDQRYLTALFKEFSLTYQFPLTYPGKYSHYGLARFPVFAKPKPAPQPVQGIIGQN